MRPGLGIFIGNQGSQLSDDFLPLPWVNPKTKEMCIVGSYPLPEDKAFCKLALSLWKREMRFWWKAWADGLDVMEPRRWYIADNRFNVVFVSNTDELKLNIDLETSHRNSDLQNVLARLRVRRMAHGDIGANVIWGTEETLEILPSLELSLLFKSYDEKKRCDDNFFYEWEPTRETKKPFSASQLEILATLEAEQLVDYERVYPYELILRKDSHPSSNEGLIIKLDTKTSHPKMGVVHRCSARDLYSELLNESEGEEISLLLDKSSDPYSKDGIPVRVSGFSQDDENALSVIPERSGEIPEHGWCRPRNIGTVELAKRKRVCLEHAVILRNLDHFSQPRKKKKSGMTRDKLVRAIVENEGVYCVQGPPGTGKTHLACEVVEALLRKDPDARVLVCAKEHAAVDLLRNRIIMRLGDNCPSNARIGRKREDSRNLEPMGTSEEWANSMIKDDRSLELRKMLNLPTDATIQAPAIISEVHGETAQLIFSTTTSAALTDRLFSPDQEPFDLVVVEEAGKCYPSELLPVLMQGRNALLIGDQKQLPPFQIVTVTESIKHLKELVNSGEGIVGLLNHNPDVYSGIRRNAGFDWDNVVNWLKPFSLFQSHETPHFQLNDQYRMTPLLSDLVSSIFYDGKFNNMRRPENCAPVFSHPVLKDMTLCWVDVPHCRKMPKAREDRGGQRYNTLELEIVRELLQKMKFIGTGEPEIAILTPYNAQVDRLSGRYGLPAVLPEKLSGIPAFNPREHVFTVDSFQGHEADLVILSLVRNNPLGSPRNAWGFIISPERLNVMFSRMRRHLVVVGCASHVRAHSDHEDMKHFASVLNYIEAKGVIMDYQNLGVRF